MYSVNGRVSPGRVRHPARAVSGTERGRLSSTVSILILLCVTVSVVFPSPRGKTRGLAMPKEECILDLDEAKILAIKVLAARFILLIVEPEFRVAHTAYNPEQHNRDLAELLRHYVEQFIRGEKTKTN